MSTAGHGTSRDPTEGLPVDVAHHREFHHAGPFFRRAFRRVGEAFRARPAGLSDVEVVHWTPMTGRFFFVCSRIGGCYGWRSSSGMFFGAQKKPGGFFFLGGRRGLAAAAGDSLALAARPWGWGRGQKRDRTEPSGLKLRGPNNLRGFSLITPTSVGANLYRRLRPFWRKPRLYSSGFLLKARDTISSSPH